MKRTVVFGSFVLFLMLQTGCNSDQSTGEKTETNSAGAEKKLNYNNDLSRYPATPGFAGVFDVPEMLSISIMDSAAMKDVSDKVKQNYTLLAKDMEAVGAITDGPPVQISYNNDPENFKFECLVLIKDLPEKTPEHSKIVVLEASKMVLFNYYGPYQDIYTAYDQIRIKMDSLKQKQSGAVREFYVTEPSLEPDEKKWLTRIFVPVSG